ncbi:MAG: hypothetical protein COX07_08040 [Bacteroidetes bacterium CG23_combo_of_CG06-09_8_20_14_all_32_9]|nr:MAG: hypothetical protein COX07_08040 [Bacteroidetes bacterium CG23_combo_of_CG06-09_8_20_14_all_32_9]
MNEKIEIVKAWLIKADHDLGTAKITYLHIPEYRDTIAFHCQQAVEKYLKAYLYHLEIIFNKSHDLVYLIDLISQKDLFSKELYDKASSLENYSVQLRYPNIVIELSDLEIQNSLKIAKEFRDLIIDKLNFQIDYNSIID